MKSKSSDNIRVRLYSFQRFLNVLLSSNELIYCPELVQFLSLNDEEFKKAKKVSPPLTTRTARSCQD
jgi:hypothetical protein